MEVLPEGVSCGASPSIWMLLISAGFTIFPPTKMPVVLQYRMFIPDLRLTFDRQKQTHAHND